MNPQPRERFALLFALALCSGAQAEPGKPAPVTPAPAPAAVPLPAQPPAKPLAPAGGTMSESKYLGLLYAEIARRTPEENAAGPGEVTASFIVGKTGKVDKVTIDKTTSPAHAEIVKKILAEVTAPPPPGGSMDLGQTFRFR
ncbi:MAG: ligand-binding protein SH3 [Methylocystis sp.]|nr:MAG: ligand-binding protein SH3 [Methylocystis sp.]